MRAAIYCRVSTKEQVQNLSLGTQEGACCDFCDREGYEVAKVFVEEGESAKTADRTELRRLLSYCQAERGRLGVVVVYSVSRLARDKLDHHTLRAMFAGCGMTLRSVTEPIDDSSTGKMIEGILATVAQFENATKLREPSLG